jgi:hypothetical protein
MSDNVRFHAWVAEVFGQPIDEETILHWGLYNLNTPLFSDAELLQCFTWLFRNSSSLLAPYTPQQIDRGIGYFGSEECGFSYAIANSAVPLAIRVDCILAIEKLYEELFMSEAGRGAAFGWWENVWTWTEGAVVRETALFDAICSVMNSVAGRLSLTCCKSVLHGANHLVQVAQYHGSDLQVAAAQQVVDLVLARNDLTPRLREYATAAREGLEQ